MRGNPSRISARSGAVLPQPPSHHFANRFVAHQFAARQYPPQTNCRRRCFVLPPCEAPHPSITSEFPDESESHELLRPFAAPRRSQKNNYARTGNGSDTRFASSVCPVHLNSVTSSIPPGSPNRLVRSGLLSGTLLPAWSLRHNRTAGRTSRRSRSSPNRKRNGAAR